MKLGVATIAIMLGGCGASTLQNANTAESYRAQQHECVVHAKTDAEATACRCELQARFGRPCAPGSAP